MENNKNVESERIKAEKEVERLKKEATSTPSVETEQLIKELDHFLNGNGIC